MAKGAVLLAIALAMMGCQSAANGQALPITEARLVKEMLHGVEIADPYRWLEGDEQGKVTDEVARWTDAQNARTRAVLDALPQRPALEKRLRELMEVTQVSPPTMRRNLYFHRKREGKQRQGILYVREGHDGQSRVLLDPNTLDKDGLVTLAWYEPSHDGKLLAFGLYRAGDEKAVAHVLEVDSGKWLSDKVEGKVGGLQWTPDGRAFFYKRLADVNNPYSAQIRYHALGSDPSQDPILFEQYKEGPLATTWGPAARISRDARWMILSYWTSTRANDLWVIDLDKWFRSGAFEPVEIIKGADGKSGGPIDGDVLYMQTTVDAPNGRVVAVDLHKPAREHWRELVPQRTDAVLENVSLARGIIAIEYQHKASSKFELFDLDGKRLRDLALPGIGSASLVTEDDRTEAFLSFASFNTPPTIFRIDLAGDGRTVWDQAAVPVDPSLVQVKQVTYKSKDNTPVTMFIVHRKGLTLDGNNPTLLTGYGGFGIGMSPRFMSTMFPWFEAGGVVAIPNLRGGGEYGEQWHRDGMLEKKQNVFDDFLAAAQWLIDNRYASSKRLAIAGGSNGGLLVGAAMTQRPDLFAAVVCDVPLLDMLRYQKFLMARYWVPEYGSSEDQKQFDVLLKYSPYHNIKDGVKYPAVYFTAGENDTRVHPLHARKMAAKMQALAGENGTADRPVLLWVDRDAGHGAGKPLHLRIRDQVDETAFLMWQLKMQPNPM